ncbi:MAG: oligosaccharide flippase family protein [Chitinophagaceae bacterium]
MSLNRTIAGIRALFSKRDTKTILTNFFSLGVIQGTNFLLPLIVLPYLVSVIGLANYGLVALAQSFVFYWIMFTDYGFHLSTTREIALHKNDRHKVAAIVCSTLVAKSILCIMAFIGFFALIELVPAFYENRPLYYLGIFMILGQSLIPVWFFQGMEVMKFITYINLTGKVIQTVLIFSLIRSSSDYIYVLLFYGIGSFIAGIAGVWLMVSRFSIILQWPGVKDVIDQLKNGWYIFLSHFAINICSNSNIFILGFFASNTTVGYFGIADKVVSIARQLVMIFFQATYPTVCKQILISHSAVTAFFKSYFIPFTLVIALLCLLIFGFADVITIFFAGDAIPEIVTAIRWMIVVPLIVCLNLPAFQTLLAYNYQKSYMMVFVACSALNIILNLILARYYLISGAITAIIITELMITGGLHAVLYIRHPENRLSAI